MILLLLACQPHDPKDSDAPETNDSDSATDTATDTGTVPEGPHCSDNWPIETPFNVLGADIVAGRATDAELADLQTLFDEYTPQIQGPWVHSTRGPMLSSDGRRFQNDMEPMLPQASVPDVTIGPDGNIYLIYVDGNLLAMQEKAEAHEAVGPGFRGFAGLQGAMSTDGTNFTPYELVFDSPVPLFAVDPDIEKMPDGTYHLYYLGIPAEEACADTPDPFQVPGPHRLYLATSTDLVHWAQKGVIWQSEQGGTDPAVWCVDATNCYLIMGATAVSTDGGLTFQNGTIGIDAFPNLPSVMHADDGYYMYYMNGNNLGLNLSTDGYNWQPETGDVGVSPSSPTAVQIDGDIWLYVSSPDQPPP